jgi:hypothetical protein
MALYSPGKEVLFNSQFTERTQAAFRQLVLRADEVIIVGAGYAKHDRHVWEPIEDTKASVFVVDPLPDGFAELKQMRDGARKTSVFCGTFADLIAAPNEVLRTGT